MTWKCFTIQIILSPFPGLRITAGTIMLMDRSKNVYTTIEALTYIFTKQKRGVS